MHQSAYANDPDMAELIEQYTQRLPREVAQLRTLLDGGDLESLRRVTHQLKGSGGGYGFNAITELAGKAEASIKQSRPLEQVRSTIDELTSYIRNVSGYEAKRETIDEPERSSH